DHRTSLLDEGQPFDQPSARSARSLAERVPDLLTWLLFTEKPRTMTLDRSSISRIVSLSGSLRKSVNRQPVDDPTFERARRSERADLIFLSHRSANEYEVLRPPPRPLRRTPSLMRPSMSRLAVSCEHLAI